MGDAVSPIGHPWNFEISSDKSSLCFSGSLCDYAPIQIQTMKENIPHNFYCHNHITHNLISLVSIDLTISQKISLILIPFLFLQPRPETYLLFQTRLYLMSFMNLSRLKLQRNHPLKVHIALCHTPVKNLAQVSTKNGNGYNNSKTKMTMMSAFCFADLVGRAGNAGQLYSAVSQLGQSSPPLRLILTIYILQGIALLLLLLHCTLGYIFHCILFKICF